MQRGGAARLGSAAAAARGAGGSLARPLDTANRSVSSYCFVLPTSAVDLLEGLFSITAAEGNGSSSGSTPALAVPDGGWLACGRSTPCEDPKACCAIWVSATKTGEMLWDP